MHAFALAQLRLGLERLGVMLDAAVRRQIARAERLARPDLTPYGITQEEALCLLADASSLLGDAVPTPPPADDEREIRLRHEARQAGATLPLDALVTRFQLTAFERFAVLACAARELDGAYGRLYAFILDDAGRKTPSVELLAALGAGNGSSGAAHCPALGRCAGPGSSSPAASPVWSCARTCALWTACSTTWPAMAAISICSARHCPPSTR